MEFITIFNQNFVEISDLNLYLTFLNNGHTEHLILRIFEWMDIMTVNSNVCKFSLQNTNNALKY